MRHFFMDIKSVLDKSNILINNVSGKLLPFSISKHRIKVSENFIYIHTYIKTLFLASGLDDIRTHKINAPFTVSIINT